MPTLAERDRRWNLLDQLCAEQSFDALIIAGNDYRGHKGGVRWVSDYNMHHRSAHAVKIPGRPASVVVSGNLAGARARQANWVDDYLFPGSIGEGLVEVIQKAGKVERIGIAGLGQILKVDELRALEAAFPGAELVEATHMFDQVRQERSAEEIEGLEESAYILDQCFTRLLEIARPGISEREIGAEMYRVAHLLGGEDPLFLTMYHDVLRDGTQYSSFAPPRSRVLGTHDVHTFSFEITGPMGYWTELSRMVTFARPSENQKRLAAAVTAGIGAAEKALNPGTSPADVQRAVIAAVESHGAKSTYWSGHSIGADVLEYPWVGLDVVEDDTNTGTEVIGVNNSITIHPMLIDEENGVSGYMSDTFVIEPSGARKLSEHRTAFYRISKGETHVIED
ncbi:MAG: M24 family metallopeptidase [Leucobacter sp.]|nr:M24 family metallopeptidase [Leucobacter sp.]